MTAPIATLMDDLAAALVQQGPHAIHMQVRLLNNDRGANVELRAERRRLGVLTAFVVYRSTDDLTRLGVAEVARSFTDRVRQRFEMVECMSTG